LQVIPYPHGEPVPVVADTDYALMTVDFLSDGGDGYAMLQEGGRYAHWPPMPLWSKHLIHLSIYKSCY
jgi:hypothetical protein